MTREEFQNLIDISGLTPEQKQLWGDIMLMLDDAQLAVLTDAINHDKTALEVLTENIQMKKKAFQSAEESLFEEILRKEKTILE